MRYIAAYLLLQIGGKSSPSASDIKKVLAAGGVEVDESRLDSLISELSGKSVAELISEGSGKLASVPSGGGAGAVASSSGGGAAPAAAEEKVEEKKEEEKEESDDDMGFGLFD